MCLKCYKFHWTYDFYTSSFISKNDNTELRGKKKFDINTRLVINFLEIGHGFEAIEKFSTLMNLPSSMSTVILIKSKMPTVILINLFIKHMQNVLMKA